MELLNAMIQANTVTDDRVAAFFTLSRRVLTLQNCGMIRNSILRQIPFRCPQLVMHDPLTGSRIRCGCS